MRTNILDTAFISYTTQLRVQNQSMFHKGTYNTGISSLIYEKKLPKIIDGLLMKRFFAISDYW